MISNTYNPFITTLASYHISPLNPSLWVNYLPFLSHTQAVLDLHNTPWRWHCWHWWWQCHWHRWRWWIPWMVSSGDFPTRLRYDTLSLSSTPSSPYSFFILPVLIPRFLPLRKHGLRETLQVKKKWTYMEPVDLKDWKKGFVLRSQFVWRIEKGTRFKEPVYRKRSILKCIIPLLLLMWIILKRRGWGPARKQETRHHLRHF